MKIVYTSHLEFRISLRNIPYHLPRRIFQEANARYYDSLTRHYVALGQVLFEGRHRDMVVVYDKKNNLIEIITVHPIKPYQKQGRVASGRWKKYE
jgi:hypothetical protein